MTKEDQFEDICPYDDCIFQEKMSHLVKEPGFEHAVKWVFPDIDFDEFCKILCNISGKDAFQHDIMWPFLEMLAKKTTTDVSCSGIEHISHDNAYTFITNHRDIVLDTSFLNLCFLRAGLQSTEVAIGSNLLIYEWISDLVRLNKSFIVKRNLPMTQALAAAKQLSAYIRYAITEKKQSVWIAEREGRAKDSNDMAQESLIKMLGLSGGCLTKENLMEINLNPVSISYEYDPNDYLKAREFLLKRNNPEYKKTQRDDLFSMETGLLQPKGRVHFEIGQCINDELATLPDNIDKQELLKTACHIIDRQIHLGYKIFPINYIAYDKTEGKNKFSDKYTEEDIKVFNEYISTQLGKIDDIPDLTDEDMDYMRTMMYTMYSNPLRNKLIAESVAMR